MPRSTRVVIIGDIGGQVSVFHRLLDSLDVDLNTFSLPKNVVVVQVGDVARASDSQELDSRLCVEIADNLLMRNPGKYIQLIGNHELAMLGDFYVNRAGVRRHSRIERWWFEKWARLAVGIRSETGEEILITHAGLTRGQWLSLQKPGLEGVVNALNDRVGLDIGSVITVGSLVTGLTNTGADVSWAEVNYEVYLPWIAHGDLPFHLVHGHASPYSWQAGDWWPDTPIEVRLRTIVDISFRRTTTFLNSEVNPGPRKAISVDWALGDRESEDVWPLLEYQATDLFGIEIRNRDEESDGPTS